MTRNRRKNVRKALRLTELDYLFLLIELLCLAWYFRSPPKNYVLRDLRWMRLMQGDNCEVIIVMNQITAVFIIERED